MKKLFLILVLISFCVAAISDFTYAEDMTTKIAKGMPKSEVELRSTMRTLWESRATLLRAYIVSAMNDSKDADEARAKLLKNTRDLGSSIQPYYGYWAKSILTGFLKNDVALTKEVIKTTKIGKKEELVLYWQFICLRSLIYPYSLHIFRLMYGHFQCNRERYSLFQGIIR